MKFIRHLVVFAILLAPCTLKAATRPTSIPNGLQWRVAADVMQVQFVAPNILRVDVRPEGRSDPRTLSIDPAFKMREVTGLKLDLEASSFVTSAATVKIGNAAEPSIAVTDNAGDSVTEPDPIADASAHKVSFERSAADPIYGIRGIDIEEEHPAFDRNAGGKVEAGIQGNGGAPFFFTAHYGVFIDSDGGAFNVAGNRIEFTGRSRGELEYFVIIGPPMEVMAGLADLTGHPPMSPKWTLGFLNSQWKCTEAELRNIVSTYRSKRIPLDGFILDFDWKAWGEDSYGEWRWNSTSLPDNYDPNKFPSGASGLLAKDLAASGVHLTGILKPRILLFKKGSTSEMLEAAAYAEQHKLWYPNEPVYQDYFTRRESKDLNFNLVETRRWIWKHIEPTFDAGIQGWWNDEADHTELLDKSDFRFDNFQFFNMGRMLYEGQRSHSDLRVWTLNRNYYLGAQRYAYAEWSGDIDTGFVHMQRQPARMLTTLNLGEPHWSMDVGGLNGHPTPENYARWMEFGAFVPIFRVHGDKFEKRQPWVYGPEAEAASTRAIKLRYELMPYIYSAERHTHETGIGIVRPLLWAYPSDASAAAQTTEWMFGGALLAAPVLEPGAKQKSVYLPEGVWHEYSTGQQFPGRQNISLNADSTTWLDIPLFVRDGSILATQPVQDFTNQSPVSEVTLDVFPTATNASFAYYDDDGLTYAYETGAYYRQQVDAIRSSDVDRLDIQPPSGTYRPTLRTFLIRIHGRSSRQAILDGKAVAPQSSEESLLHSAKTGWATSTDRFGPVTVIRVDAQRASTLSFR